MVSSFSFARIRLKRMDTSIIPQLKELFSAHKVPFILVGGLALHFHNFDRMTTDIDFMIADSDFKTIKPHLESLGYKLFAEEEAFARFDGSLKKLMNLDLLFVDQETFDTIRKEGKEIELRKTTVTVPSLYHLIALKLHAMKQNPKFRELKDFPDIIELIYHNKIDVREPAFQQILLKYGSKETFDKIMGFFSEDK
jgi:hypothetical protein